MAKKSMIAREKKRAKLVEKYAIERTRLKEVISSPDTSEDDQWAALVALQKQPRNASPSRGVRRCQITGRPHAVYRKFGLSRNKLREYTMAGDVPGLKKASW